MLKIFFHLLRRDLKGFRREYPGKFYDTAFLFFTNIIIFGYFMSEQWASPNYGPFLLIGAIASFGLIEIVGKINLLLADIHGERTISQSLILPIRPFAIFLYIGFFWAISSMLLSVLLFPFGKLLLLKRFDLTAISYIRLIPIYISANLFYGFFAIWLCGVLKGMSNMSTVFMRFINPLWMFGAYFYSWYSVYDFSHSIAYISLINPIVYIMEGMRAAALGQEGYLPYWICMLVIWGFIFATATHGISRLKKRLDCI